MIVRILKKSASFKGVRYNTNKVEKDKGELLAVRNFGALMGIKHLRPSDYINYLEALSAKNKRIRFPQFHAVISAKGRSVSKEGLLKISELWLKEMGYGDQPYLVVFHKDTDNNHVHLVSTRVNRLGKKIEDSFEKVKAVNILDKILGLGTANTFDQDLAAANAFRFSTRAQFLLLLERMGYLAKLEDDHVKFFKANALKGQILLKQIDAKISVYQKPLNRILQIRSLIDKYKLRYNPEIFPVRYPLAGKREIGVSGYNSELSNELKKKFGLEFCFHFKGDRPPYGYTLIDHAKGQVFKGCEIISLPALLQVPAHVKYSSDAQVAKTPQDDQSPPKGLYAFEYPSSAKAVNQELTEFEDSGYGFPAEEILYQQSAGEDQGAGWLETESYEVAGTEGYSSSMFYGFQIDLSDDIDDEAVLGRNRRHKKKAKTNSR